PASNSRVAASNPSPQRKQGTSLACAAGSQEGEFMRRLCPVLLLLVSAGCGRFASQPAADTSESDDPSPPAAVSGQVRNSHGPVAGARVRFKGPTDFVTPGSDGRFALPVPPNNADRVVAWKQGYFIAGARADASDLVLHLRPLPAEDCERYAWVDPAPDVSK